MKILLISGHTSGYNSCKATGVNEGDLTIELVRRIANRLEGYAEISVYPYDRDMYKDNKNGCLKVNLKDYDYIFEVHFNGFNGKARGTEVLIHSDYKGGISVEKNILAKMVLLGFTNRGIKYRNDLLNMKTCLDLGIDYALLETCFFDNVEDMKLYKAKKDKVADAVADGIIGGFGLTKNSTGIQGTDLNALATREKLDMLAPYYQETQQKHNILASVRMAQLIKESSIFMSELGQQANNGHGSKCMLSGNTWEGSVWDGSVYTKATGEWSDEQGYHSITADFRKYPCCEDSIRDQAAYLARAKDGSELRYAALIGERDFRKAAEAIKNGGYATSPTYIEDLVRICDVWDLTRYDLPEETKVLYKVQCGAFSVKENAEELAERLKKAGFESFIEVKEV